jgi:ribosome biogenesis GTPase / thiamine phosphate phosphatase
VNDFRKLANLGWQPHFQQQITLDEWDASTPARIVEQHRSQLELAGEQGNSVIPIAPSMPTLTLGDWILLDRDGQFSRLLERQSWLRRRRSGEKQTEQLLAANVDTAFILYSLNDDFNLNRIERYLSVIHDAGAEPVVVLSKLDLCSDPEPFREQAQSLDSSLCIEMVNALDADSTSSLFPWCSAGKTIVMLGSSGVGKSTLTNSLLGEEVQNTDAIREDDSKGRHTTTSRSLLPMESGAMLLDTPGMRELQMANFESGIAATFSDIEELARQCKFADCNHASEPGCAIQLAIENENLEQRRFDSYLKLQREQQLYNSTLAERRAKYKALGKYYKRTITESANLKRGE